MGKNKKRSGYYKQEKTPKHWIKKRKKKTIIEIQNADEHTENNVDLTNEQQVNSTDHYRKSYVCHKNQDKKQWTKDTKRVIFGERQNNIEPTHKNIDLTTMPLEREKEKGIGKRKRVDLTESMEPPLKSTKNQDDVNNSTQDERVYDEEQENQQDLIIGRRIVDVSFFLKQLENINSHNAKFGCNLSHLQINSEQKKGLDSKIVFKCRMCGQSFDAKLVENIENTMDINHQAVSGIMSCGSGHSHLQTFTASMGLPGISSNYYESINEHVCDWWDTTAAECITEAVHEEAQYAISIGSVDEQGRPLIDVAVDGCWSKRSYGKQYNALSGAAAIIGLRFGKVLYLGVKNKYCSFCSRAAKGEDGKIPEPKCYKNFSGPSTAMESSIIVEGFRRSLPDHGVIYHRFVADGDASTLKKIQDARPYGPDLVVEKIECKNHLLRNYCNALVRLCQNTSYPAPLRKIIKDRYLRLRTGVTCAIKHWEVQNLTHRQKVDNLTEDILNGPLHVFGNHENCKDYFCTPEKRHSEPIGLLAALDGCGLLSEMLSLNRKLSQHAGSLIYNVTSNLVESFNSQISKYVGGKRINFSLRRSYASRCAAGLVSFNTGTLHTTTHKTIFHSDPNNVISKLEQLRLKKRQQAKTKIKARRFHNVESRDAHYGDNCEKPDMPLEIFKAAKKDFIDGLKLSFEERVELERATTSQRNSAEWLRRRRKLLTSSNFGAVCKRRESTSCASLVKKILYDNNISFLPAIKYGINNEEIAKKQLEEQEGVTIHSCGLFVDEEYEFLATTPDGAYADGIVEIKCPPSLSNLPLEEAMQKHPLWKQNRAKEYVINTQHSWHFQIQGQLHITGADICMLGIWFGKDTPMKVHLIQKDVQFWDKKMLPKLTKFYDDCILPELVDPRVCRNMPIKDPDYIVEAIDKKKNKNITK